MLDGKKSSLRIEWLPVDQLKPDPRNPRKHNDRQINQLAQSIASLDSTALF